MASTVHRMLGPLSMGVVLSGCSLAAVWLFHDLGGPVAAVAIAETRSYRVSSAETARLASVDVAEGEIVQAGQVVAKLDTSVLRREMAVAMAGLQVAASDVHATGATLDGNEMQTERAFRSELEQAEVALHAAQSEQTRERNALSAVRADAEAERSLVKRGLVRADRLKQMEVSLASLEAAVGTWPSRLASIEARRDAARAGLSEWQSAHGPLGAKAAQLLPVRDRVQGRQQEITLLRMRLDGAMLRAAAASYVSSVHTRAGDVVNAGDPIVTLVELHPKQVIAYVDERRTDLRAGDSVTVRRRTGGRDPVAGTIAAVGADVVAVPQRLWANPHTPAWGRAVYISVAIDGPVGPGELVDVVRPEPLGSARELMAKVLPWKRGVN